MKNYPEAAKKRGIARDGERRKERREKERKRRRRPSERRVEHENAGQRERDREKERERNRDLREVDEIGEDDERKHESSRISSAKT